MERGKKRERLIFFPFLLMEKDVILPFKVIQCLPVKNTNGPVITHRFRK